MADAAHTYDETLSTNLARVRFRLQDTRHPWAFTDAEINHILGSATNVAHAVVQLARIGLVNATRQARTYSNEQGSEDLVSRVALYQSLIRELEKESTSTLPRISWVELGDTPSHLTYND